MPQHLPGVINCNPYRICVVFSLTLAVSLLGSGCTETPERSTVSDPSAIAQQNIKPNPTDESAGFTIAVIPWQVTEAQEEKLQPLADYLTQVLQKPVHFEIVENYETSVNLLIEKKVALAFLGPVTYLQAKERDPGVEPLVSPIDRTTGRPWYTSIIVANRERGIEKLEDLKGKRFAFVSPSSTSGYLVPMLAFKNKQINPNIDFATVEYGGSHTEVKELLLSGAVDAIADDKRSYRTLEQDKTKDLSSYHIIWESEPIPNIPLVASSELSVELKNQLKLAFIKAPSGLLDPTGTESGGYTLTNDEDYNTIREIQNILEEKQP